MSSEGSAPALPEIGTGEYRRRLGQIQAAMAEERLDALLITSEDNYRYITGFDSPTWHNLTRPRYCIVPASGDPFVIVPSNNVPIVEETSWIGDVRSWVSPNPVDDGVSMTVDGLKSCAGPFNRIGAELGPESRLTMPVRDFLRIREAMEPVEIVDGDWMMRRLRMIKSAVEVARIRHVCQIVSHGFEALPNRIRVGDTERKVCETLHLDLLRRGADKVPYIVGTAGRGGYSSLHLPPKARAVDRGEVMYIDIAASCEGYYCDFNREFGFGRPSDRIRRLYETVWRATEAGIAAVEPGRTTGDIWRAEAEAITSEAEKAGFDVAYAKGGRMGHGVGLRMCEPPSVSTEDGTVLEPGMVLTIEPAVEFVDAGDDDHPRKTMVHEENVVVTEGGVELLTRRAPAEMPYVE